MQKEEIKSITYIDPASGRPILRTIHDLGGVSFADENINLGEVVETLNALEHVIENTVFVEALADRYAEFVTLLTKAQSLSASFSDFDQILSLLNEMYIISRAVAPSAGSAFIKTNLKPYLKAERHNV